MYNIFFVHQHALRELKVADAREYEPKLPLSLKTRMKTPFVNPSFQRFPRPSAMDVCKAPSKSSTRTVVQETLRTMM